MANIFKMSLYFCVVIIICAPGDDFRELMLVASDLGYTDGSFVYLFVELLESKSSQNYDWSRGDGRYEYIAVTIG